MQMIIENLTYKDILHDINLNIPKGINYLKGKNGSGKSTLLDCISNINKDYIGNIDGNKSTVYLNQNVYFSYRLKSYDFVDFICTIEGIKKYENKFLSYLKKYNLDLEYEKIKNKEVGKLSGGERVKLFFITICFIDREWYIFDEPFAGVDDDGKKCMISVIEELLCSNKGIIITTHEMEPLSYFNEINIIEIDNGKIIEKNKIS